MTLTTITDPTTGREFDIAQVDPDTYEVYRKDTLVGHALRYTADSEWGFRALDGRFDGGDTCPEEAVFYGTRALGIG